MLSNDKKTNECLGQCELKIKDKSKMIYCEFSISF